MVVFRSLGLLGVMMPVLIVVAVIAMVMRVLIVVAIVAVMMRVLVVVAVVAMVVFVFAGVIAIVVMVAVFRVCRFGRTGCIFLSPCQWCQREQQHSGCGSNSAGREILR